MTIFTSADHASDIDKLIASTERCIASGDVEGAMKVLNNLEGDAKGTTLFSLSFALYMKLARTEFILNIS